MQLHWLVAVLLLLTRTHQPLVHSGVDSALRLTDASCVRLTGTHTATASQWRDGSFDSRRQ